jgi:steroid delta-isomerase-like uncharacterized protein
MATTGAERVLDDWAAAWSSPERVEQLLSLFPDDCIYEDVTFGVVNRGKAELRAFAEGVFAAVPDFTVELTSRFATSDRGGIEWVLTGTHRGDFPGLPATGRRFSVRGATVDELRDGKIQRLSDYWDSGTFMKQVGLLPGQ